MSKCCRHQKMMRNGRLLLTSEDEARDGVWIGSFPE